MCSQSLFAHLSSPGPRTFNTLLLPRIPVPPRPRCAQTRILSPFSLSPQNCSCHLPCPALGPESSMMEGNCWKTISRAKWTKSTCGSVPRAAVTERQKQRLTTTDVYSPTARKARSPSQGVRRATLPPEALGDSLSTCLPVSGGSKCPSSWLCDPSLPPSLRDLLHSSLRVSYKDNVIGFRSLGDVGCSHL